ncbi:hypothetical protein BLL52_2783 [Rhodoferax antarcticus ANT.BR]|uniref:Uncharacterized protein n=1 Tax=Rhodoferax antarcticus ANT.BR TaxID=1111071 RepID=A0A1Q8YEW6_9BURK|nr:hypothetical protein RA876_07995 [Rhodoferax antarcticus]OLP06547.1 hypothetical protein BLL52_2783 [Rhodoferax antarcticus ANT.BR]
MRNVDSASTDTVFWSQAVCFCRKKQTDHILIAIHAASTLASALMQVNLATRRACNKSQKAGILA